MKKTFLCLLVFTGFATAQPIGAGVKLGTTLTDAVSSLPGFPFPNGNHFIVGPYVEVRLPLGLAVEGDALYIQDLYAPAGTTFNGAFSVPPNPTVGGVPGVGIYAVCTHAAVARPGSF